MVTPILRRFVIAYSVLLSLMVAVSSYSVFQLGQLSRAAHIAVNVEQRMLDHTERLADAFLSEVRYAGKFSVTQAPVHYDQYKQFKADFDRYLAQLKALDASKEAMQRLSRAEVYQAQYHQLFEKEVQYIKAKQPYAETRYREDKERLVDYLLREHDAFKSDLQNSLQQRIGYIETAALKSQKITLAATLLLASMGVICGYWLAGKLPSRAVGALSSQGAAWASRLRGLSWWKDVGARK